jgi:hypothetical protein
MYAVNDALADQIIRASVARGPGTMVHYLPSSHADAVRSLATRPRRVSLLAAIGATRARIVALVAAPAPTPPACCAAA